VRRWTALIVLPLALAACSGGDHDTSLEIDLYVSGYADANEIAMRLSCDPPAGNVASAAASCAAVRERGRELFPPSRDVTCIGGLVYIDVSVRGTVGGKDIERDYGHCGDARPILAWVRAMRLTLLRITIVSHGRSRELTLGCAPDLGTVVDPRRSCRSLARVPQLLTRPGTSRGRCGQLVFVSGLHQGNQIDRLIGCSQPARVRRWIELALGFYTPPRERLRGS
jgi:hypothetical protein